MGTVQVYLPFYIAINMPPPGELTCHVRELLSRYSFSQDMSSVLMLQNPLRLILDRSADTLSFIYSPPPPPPSSQFMLEFSFFDKLEPTEMP